MACGTWGEVDQSDEPALQRSEPDDVVPLQVGQQPVRLEQHREQEGQRVGLEDSLPDLWLCWGEPLRIRHNWCHRSDCSLHRREIFVVHYGGEDLRSDKL